MYTRVYGTKVGNMHRFSGSAERRGASTCSEGDGYRSLLIANVHRHARKAKRTHHTPHTRQETKKKRTLTPHLYRMMSRNFASGVSTVPSSNHRDRTGNSCGWGWGEMRSKQCAARGEGGKRAVVAAKLEVRRCLTSKGGPIFSPSPRNGHRQPLTEPK